MFAYTGLGTHDLLDSCASGGFGFQQLRQVLRQLFTRANVGIQSLLQFLQAVLAVQQNTPILLGGSHHTSERSHLLVEGRHYTLLKIPDPGCIPKEYPANGFDQQTSESSAKRRRLRG